MQILCGLQVVFFLFNCQTPALFLKICENDLHQGRSCDIIMKLTLRMGAKASDRCFTAACQRNCRDLQG